MLHGNHQKRIKTYARHFALIILMLCIAAWGPGWVIIRQTSRNPTRGVQTYVVAPTEYQDVQFDGVPESVWLSTRTPKQAASWQADKARLDYRFIESANQRAKGALSFSKIIQNQNTTPYAIITLKILEYKGSSWKGGVVRGLISIRLSSEQIGDEIGVDSRLTEFSVGENMEKAGKVFGVRLVEYLQERGQQANVGMTDQGISSVTSPKNPGAGQGECALGQVISQDTEKHCCWPGQAWNGAQQICVGIPRCPKGFIVNAKNQSCEVPICQGGKVRAPDGFHCCWPGQAWAKSRNVCIGVPITCPDGTTLSGEDCLGTAFCPIGMAFVPGGSFQTLDTKELVQIEAFCIDRYEATVDEYQSCMQRGRCSNPAMDIESKYCNIKRSDRGKHPINCVTAEQATNYCRELGRRLPYDEEWEWAARGAGATMLFPWGEGSPTKTHMCWDENRGANTCMVGSFPAGVSKQGVHDLSGNVNEWTIHKGKANIVRGGSWDTDSERVFRIKHRTENPDQDWGRRVGFRCVQEPLGRRQ